MRQLIDDAYHHNVTPPEIQDFIDDVALAVAQHRARHIHDDPTDRYRGGLGLV